MIKIVTIVAVLLFVYNIYIAVTIDYTEYSQELRRIDDLKYLGWSGHYGVTNW